MDLDTLLSKLYSLICHVLVLLYYPFVSTYKCICCLEAKCLSFPLSCLFILLLHHLELIHSGGWSSSLIASFNEYGYCFSFIDVFGQFTCVFSSVCNLTLVDLTKTRTLPPHPISTTTNHTRMRSNTINETLILKSVRQQANKS